MDQDVKHLQALLDVSKALVGKFQLEDLLQIIIQKTSDVLDAERSSLFLFDEKRQELWTKIAQGLDDSETIRFPIGVGIAGEVAKTRQGQNIPDAQTDPRFNPAFDKQTGYRTRSMLCLPLIGNNERLIGVIQVLNKKGGKEFDQRDTSLLEALSAYAAIALERAQLMQAYIEKQRMEEALRVAHDIQMDLLPQGLPPFPNASIIDLHAILIPAQEVGGDLYDYFLIDDQHIFFVVGDVSGKGVPAALFMAVTQTLVKAFARKGLTPHEVLAAVNTELCLHNPSCMFVTLFCGILNTQTVTLDYANAGHNPPFFISRGQEGHFLEISDGTAVGILEEARFTTHTIQLKPHDSLLIYTDGITESMNAQKALFAEERLQQVVRHLHTQSSRDIINGILEKVRNFSEGQPQADDITLMNIKIGQTE